MSQLFYLPFKPVYNARGLPSAAASVTFYASGTTNKLAIYADANLTTPLLNPVIADGIGKLPDIYMPSNAIYRVRVLDRLGAQLGDDIDPYIPGTLDGLAGPSGPSNNTRLTLAALKAASTTDKTSLYDGSLWTWTVGNYTGLADDVNVVQANGTALTVGAWVRQLADTVYLRTFGADPTGTTSSVAAFNAALVAGKRVIGAPGDVYLLDTSVVVPAGREIIGNGATLKIAAGLEGGLRIANGGCKVSGWTLQGGGGGYAVWAKSLDATPVEFVDFTDNVCTGNIGHYLLCTNARHVLVTGNRVDGLTANTEITTAIVAEGSRHITVTNNKFRNVTVGWSVQIRGGSSDFTISNNTFEQTQYSDTKTATTGQTVFTFTFAQSCFLRKIQIGGKPLSTGYTVSGAGPVYTVTFAAGRTAGDVVKLVGYRGAENIQINGATQGVISGNSIDGTADSGIIALGSYLTISANKVRNCGYAGIAIYGDIDNIVVADNVITDCAQMDDGLSSPDNPLISSVFAGAILASGEGAAISGNTIINNAPYTMRYGINVNKTNQTLRTDGSASLNIGVNNIRGDFLDGRIIVPNQSPGERANSIAVDGALITYPGRLDDAIAATWVEYPATSGRFQPPDNAFFTVDGSALTRAVRDTSIIEGGVASLQTVSGQYIDFILSAAAILYNTIVEVSFRAKAAGGASYVDVLTTLAGATTGPRVPITKTTWERYTVRIALTPNLEKAIRIRIGATSGSANVQNISINGRQL